MRVLKISVALLLLSATCGQAAVLRVPSDYPTIQAGIDASADGDTVLVAAGTYTGEGNRDIEFGTKSLTVKSEEGPETCVIDCQGSEGDPHRGFRVYRKSVIDGFKVINGYVKDSGGGIFSDDGTIIKNCIVKNCIVNNEPFRYGGGGISIRGGAVINSIVAHNRANRDGGGILALSGGPAIINCTIVGNQSSGSGGGIYCGYNGTATLTNCIVVGNSAVSGNQIVARTTLNRAMPMAIEIRNSCIQSESCDDLSRGGCSNDFRGSSMITLLEDVIYTADPRFVDPNGGDFRLRYDSPCIDAGADTSAYTIPTTDIDGRSRVIDGDCDGVAVIDLGALEADVPDEAGLRPLALNFEFNTHEDTLSAEAQQLTIRKVGPGTISWHAVSDASWLDISPDSEIQTDGTADVTLKVDASRLTAGIYEQDVEFHSSDAAERLTHVTVVLNIAETLTVPDEFASIQEAVDAATVPGTRIILRDGTYKGVGNRDIAITGVPVSLVSENGPDNCIIDCEGSKETPRQAFVLAQPGNHQTVIEGIEIRGFGASMAGVIDCQYGSPIIRNCRIKGSSSMAISCRALTHMLIENCFVEGLFRCYPADLDIHRSVINGNIIAPDLDIHSCVINGSITCSYGQLSIVQSVVGLHNQSSSIHIRNGDGTIADSTINGGISLLECGSFDVKDSTIQKADGSNIWGDATYININRCMIRDADSSAIDCRSDQINISDSTIIRSIRGITLQRIPRWPPTELKDCTVSIQNCLITNNEKGISCSFCDVTIEDCGIIANNDIGISLSDCDSSVIRRSVICGNRTNYAGIKCHTSHAIIENCTIASNVAKYGGGAVFGDSSDESTHIELLNCILWENGPRPVILLNDSVADANYCNIQGGWPGVGNVDVDPLFARYGHWDPNGTPEDVYDDLWVDGDYHLKSEAGRWEAHSESWVLDDVTSPCIDASDPNSPVMSEPSPNGGIINMGAYGGTVEASKSP
jgi:hypothetical protein